MHKQYRKLFAVIIIALVLLTADMLYVMYSSNDLEQPVSIQLSQGSSIRTLAGQLDDKDLLDHALYFEVWARLLNKATRLQAGEYMIQPGDSLAHLLNKMVSGKVRQYDLTLLEGWTFKQFMATINTHHAIKHTLTGKKPDKIMEILGYPGQHPEGRFFPDTYHVHKNITDVAILNRAYDIMATKLEQLWQQRDPDLPLQTPYEALILASIVEKETAVAEERPIIAGVFINRLRKKMRLQTDPTVIYGLGDDYDGDIRFRDLRRDTPYNTYTRKGLPPTPIAMPGSGALKAVMHPAKTDYLYFVAVGDGSGRHVFTTNLADHETEVERFLKTRRKRQ